MHHKDNYHQIAVDEFIKSLYPKLIVDELIYEIPISTSASTGITIAEKIYYNCVPDDSINGVVLAEKIPPKFLGFLHRIAAIVTLEEDPSTHTSIVCRAQGVPVVNLTRSDFENLCTKAKNLNEGNFIAVDTFQKKILIGKIRVEDEHIVPSRRKALLLIKHSTSLDVNANADTASELKRSIELGFEHAWPRSETLLYEPTIFPYFIAFLLCPINEVARQKFIEGHTNEVRKLFNESQGTRIAFRLLDPPSHEFLPSIDDVEEIDKISKILDSTREEILKLIKVHIETNPMIGHRGARLLLTNKKMLHAQAVSIFNGWKDADPNLRSPFVEILIPFVMLPAELKSIKEFVSSIRSNNLEFSNIPVKYGCMIEVPSILDYPVEIASEVDFISFGTNDLVSIMHGIARGDAYERYLSTYLREKIIDNDPFFILPSMIINKIQEFCLKAKKINPNITTDICGEHALNTNLASLITSGALNAVSIGTENLPILLRSLIESQILKLPENNQNVLKS